MSQIRNALAIVDQIARAKFLADTLQECGHEISTADILDVLAIGGYRLVLDTTSFPSVAYQECLALNLGGETE